MLTNEQTKRGLTDRQVAEENGWLQQTFSRWKLGSLPRPNMYASIAQFLMISDDMMRELVEEAAVSTGNTKLPAMTTARTYGRVSDRKEGKYAFEAFNQGRKRIPEGRYSITIDTKIMEPALPVGTRAWIDPAIWPTAGNEVLVHAKGGHAWLGRLVSVAVRQAEIERNNGTITVRDVEAVHVIVLSERLPAVQN
ncbi:XRE family transcriptional regulator [Rhizobium leguminosarum]|uniref:XRE family transcriptional regulator n=1 Tax=Rhizobium leguminosarum TaxID=384 RepID=UPI000FEC5230|nr:XRE family transcriptional regulator [Rhizobium leguminosarum]RWX26621.1 XRE family transcriptional regulator [Rhizobium leguminosarum]